MAICGCSKCGAIQEMEFGLKDVLSQDRPGCKCGGSFLPVKAEYVYEKLERVKDDLFRLRMNYHDDAENSAKHIVCELCQERAEKAEREATRLRYLVGAMYNATCDRPLEKAQEVHLFEVIDSLRSETTGKPAPTDQPKERISSDE